MKVFILGSCVSRDIFRYTNPDEFNIVEYVARSSISSMFAGKPFEDTFSQRLESKFQARIVNMDIVKQARYKLATVDADVILIDLIDERFDLIETEPYRYCTVSSEFVKTGAMNELGAARRIRSGSDQFLRYWKNGWADLVKLLRARDKIQKIRINKVLWQDQTESGAPYAGMSTARVAAANALLQSMYAHMALDLAPHQFFEYAPSIMKGADSHDWEPAPFHYIDAFYLKAAEYLRSACLASHCHAALSLRLISYQKPPM